MGGLRFITEKHNSFRLYFIAMSRITKRNMQYIYIFFFNFQASLYERKFRKESGLEGRGVHSSLVSPDDRWSAQVVQVCLGEVREDKSKLYKGNRINNSQFIEKRCRRKCEYCGHKQFPSPRIYLRETVGAIWNRYIDSISVCPVYNDWLKWRDCFESSSLQPLANSLKSGFSKVFLIHWIPWGFRRFYWTYERNNETLDRRNNKKKIIEQVRKRTNSVTILAGSPESHLRERRYWRQLSGVSDLRVGI